MPELQSDVSAVLSLYQRCKFFRVLPIPGTLFDQPAWLMEAFDLIESRVSLYKQRKREEAETEMKQAELKRGNNG